MEARHFEGDHHQPIQHGPKAKYTRSFHRRRSSYGGSIGRDSKQGDYFLEQVVWEYRPSTFARGRTNLYVSRSRGAFKKMYVLKGEEGMGALGFDHSCSPCAAEVYKRLVNFLQSHL